MSDSVRPHRWQPTRLPCPWDSPGKNTGVSCHFLLQCMKVKSESEVAQSCPTLSEPMDCSLPGSSVHGFSSKNTGVGCHCLLRVSTLPILIYHFQTATGCLRRDATVPGKETLCSGLSPPALSGRMGPRDAGGGTCARSTPPGRSCRSARRPVSCM